MIWGILFTASALAYEVPRTSYGDPDLQGYWSNASRTTLEIQGYAPSVVLRPKVARRIENTFARLREEDDAPFYKVHSHKTQHKRILGVNRGWGEPAETFAEINGEIRAAWITDPATGKIPYLPSVRRELRTLVPKRKHYFNMETIPNADRCLMGFGLPAGPPMINEAYNTAYQIAQSPGHVAIWVENVHDVRIIRLNAPRLPVKMRPWMGDSIGHWDGDTLVAETRGMNPQQAITRSTQGKVFISPDAVVTEKFTRASAGEILYQFEVEDPKVYEKKWKGEVLMNAIKGPVYEYACHEGNRSLVHQMEGARLPGLDPEELMMIKGEP